MNLEAMAEAAGAGLVEIAVWEAPGEDEGEGS